MIKIGMWQENYTGEINRTGKPHGEGSYTNMHGDRIQGTFLANNVDGNPDGYCHKMYSHGDVSIGEMKDGQWDGKVTDYYMDGLIANLTYSEGCLESQNLVKP